MLDTAISEGGVGLNGAAPGDGMTFIAFKPMSPTRRGSAASSTLPGGGGPNILPSSLAIVSAATSMLQKLNEFTITRDVAQTAHGNIFGVYWNYVGWNYTVRNSAGNPVPGVSLQEAIAYSDGHYFVHIGTRTANQTTDSAGMLGDRNIAAFIHPDGSVRATQTIQASRIGQIQWSIIMHANGLFTVDTYTATFH
jgi:hypothetical protein